MGDTKLPAHFKHDWYQTETTVVITVLIKNIKQDNLKLEFTSDRVNLTIKGENETEDINKIFNLSHEISPDESTYKLTPLKIEIKLKKVEGLRWDKLEGPSEKLKVISIEVPKTDKPPAYPTSKGTNWSEVEKNLTKSEAEEKPEGEEALNKLFQEIYGKGSDEVKKAMNKSFTESNGTILSTNWNEISKQKVDCKPPDGMEFKKWDQ